MYSLFKNFRWNPFLNHVKLITNVYLDIFFYLKPRIKGLRIINEGTFGTTYESRNVPKFSREIFFLNKK